jgi:predicted transcriptional regulator
MEPDVNSARRFVISTGNGVVGHIEAVVIDLIDERDLTLDEDDDYLELVHERDEYAPGTPRAIELDAAILEMEQKLIGDLSRRIAELEAEEKRVSDRVKNRAFVEEAILPVVLLTLKRNGVATVKQLPRYVFEILERNVERAFER